MSDRLHVFPLELLTMWQATHGPLAPHLREEFVHRPICLEIGRYPTALVASAIRRNKKLTAVLDDLRATRTTLPHPPIPAPAARPSSPPIKSPPPRHLPDLDPPARRMTRAQKWLAADDRIENPSDAERLLWDRLRNRQLDGFFFLREFSIKAWWADFYCAAGKLVIEVDGVQHRERRDKDAERDRVMIAAGYQVMRIPARRVYQDLDTVLKEIRKALNTPKALAHRDAYRRSAAQKTPPRTSVQTARPTARKKAKRGRRAPKNPHALFECSACGREFPQAAHKPARCPSCGSRATPK